MTLRNIDRAARRAVVFTPMERRRHVLVDAAVLADQLGYEAMIIPEGWGFDAGVLLAEIATRTQRIRLVTGIASIWGRTPATLAMMAATIDDMSNGRFTLGLGASTATLAEQFHDVSFAHPAAHLDHVVEQVRALLDGERIVTRAGQRGLRLGQPPRPALPIWVAGLGPMARTVARRRGNGWFPALVPRDHLGELRATVVAGGSGDPDLICGPMAAVDDDVIDARASAEQLVGWYLTGMGSLYGDFVASFGYRTEVDALRDANPRPAPGAVTWPRAADPVLDQLAALGDAQQIQTQLAQWDQQADIVAVCVGPATYEAVLGVIEAAAPASVFAGS